jgi:hypothetical protein
LAFSDVNTAVIDKTLKEEISRAMEVSFARIKNAYPDAEENLALGLM